MGPNIVLIVFDTARADALEPYGAPRGASPAVADLAAAGAATPATFATACWTMPSHMSLLSGQLPRAAGFRPAGGMAGYRPQVEAMRSRMLPAKLGGAGYETFGLSTNLWISRVTGFDAAFDRFAFVRGWRTKKLAGTGWRNRASWYAEALKAQVDDGAAEAGRLLDDWLSRRRHSPFFCFVNLIECHSPYLPPKPYNDLRANERLKAAQEARRHLTLSSIWKCSTGGFDVPTEAISRMRRLYRASIRQLDDWLARLLDALDHRGMLADTQVVVTSDHGENLGEARMLGHAFSLDDRLLRVPLVTAGPGSLPPEGLLSLSELPGWLLELAGAGDERVAPHGSFDGVAVAEFDAPFQPGDRRLSEAIRAWKLGEKAAAATVRLTTSFACATDGSTKLVRRLGREELFDLATDPLEEHPVVVSAQEERTHAASLGRLRAALNPADAERFQPEAAPVDEGLPFGAIGVSDEETAQLEAQMRLLGYL